MCCFSKPVRSVTNTQIFCRVGAKGYQVVVYSMLQKCSKASGTVRPKQHIYKKLLMGKLKNEDVVIGAAINV